MKRFIKLIKYDIKMGSVSNAVKIAIFFQKVRKKYNFLAETKIANRINQFAILFFAKF